MSKITGLDYCKMSKHDIYKEYCKVYEEYEKNTKKEIERSEAEMARLKAELEYANFMAGMAVVTQQIERK